MSRVLTLSQRALSRSGKKVLHMDSNQYYGGPDAAFSFDEAQEWVTEVTQGMFSSCHPLLAIWLT